MLRSLVPLNAPSTLAHMAGLVVLLWLCLAPGLASAQTAYPPLVLDVTASTRYQMKADPRTGEVRVRIIGGGPNIVEQVERWNHPLLRGAVALPRSGGEVVIRLRLRWRVTVYGALKNSPPRLILGLGSPVESAGALYGRTAVDFMGPRTLDAEPATAVAAAPPRPLTFEEKVQRALYLPNAAPVEADPNHPLALGSRVLYAIDHPSFPAPMPPWEPTFDTPARIARSAPARVRQLWQLAQDGQWDEALRLSNAMLETESLDAWRIELRYLQAGLLYMLAGNEDIPPLQPVERGRLAYLTGSEHPLAEQTQYLTALGYIRLGFYSEASKLLHELATTLDDRDPHLPGVLLALGLADHVRGKQDQALESLTEALQRLEPGYKDAALLAIAAAKLDGGQGRSGDAFLSLLSSRNSALVDTEYFRHLQAEAYYRTNQFSLARKHFLALVEDNPDPRLKPWLQLRVAESLLMEQEYTRAMTFLTYELDVQPLEHLEARLTSTLWKLRRIQLRMMRQGKHLNTPLIQNLEALRLEVPLNPVEPEVLFELGMYYYRTQSVHAAVPYFRELFNRYPHFPFRETTVDLIWKGFKAEVQQQFSAGQPFAVASLYEQFLPIIDAEGVGDAESFFQVAQSYVELGLYDKAYHALAPTFFLANTSDEARANAALMTASLQRMRGHPEDALPAIEFVEKKARGEDLRARAGLEQGRVFEAMGKPHAAMAAYHHLSHTHPHLPDSVEALLAEGRLLLDEEELDRALSVLTEAVTSADEHLSSADATRTPDQVDAHPEQGDTHHAAPGDAHGGGDGQVHTGAHDPTSTADQGDPALGSHRAVWSPPTQQELEEMRVEALYLLGEAALDTQSWEPCEAAFERALALRPDFPSSSYARLSRGRALRALGRTEEAQALWSTLIESGPRDGNDPWPALAEQLLAQSRWQDDVLENRH